MKMVLWPLAIVIAGAWVATGPLHGRDVRVLRGRVPRGLLRLVVLALVMLGAGKETAGQGRVPEAVHDPLLDAPQQKWVPMTVASKAVIVHDTVPRSEMPPAGLGQEQVTAWAQFEAGHIWADPLKVQDAARQALLRPRAATAPADAPFWMPVSLARVVSGEDGANPGPARTSDLAQAAMDLARKGVYDGSVIAYLWSRSSATAKPDDAVELAALYALLEDMARTENALRLAAAQNGPINFTPFMSKAARPLELENTLGASSPRIAAAALSLFPKTDAGLWESDGVLSFRLPEDATGCVLMRRGKTVALKGGDFVQLRRLDIVVTGGGAGAKPILAEHRTLGKLRLPADGMITARNAAALLDDGARKKIGEWVQAALAGDGDAVQLLEMALPLTAPAVREALGRAKGLPGEAALRMVLEAFED